MGCHATYSEAGTFAKLANEGSLQAICQLNQVQCHLKLGEWQLAHDLATTVLARDSDNAKALFRRGIACTQLKKFDAAKADLREACRLEPKSKEVRDAFAECKRLEAAATQDNRAMSAKMVDGAGGFEQPTPEQPTPAQLQAAKKQETQDRMGGALEALRERFGSDDETDDIAAEIARRRKALFGE